MITGEKEMSENKVKKIQNGYYTGERPLFHGEHLEIGDTIFGEGESPLKESSDITLKNSMFQWKYPLWYSKNVLLLISTVNSGKTARRAMECIEYYGGSLQGIAAELT